MSFRVIVGIALLSLANPRVPHVEAQARPSDSQLGVIRTVSDILSFSPKTRKPMRDCIRTVRKQHETELETLQLLADVAVTQSEKRDRIDVVRAYATVSTDLFGSLCSYLFVRALGADLGSSAAPGIWGTAGHFIELSKAHEITDAGFALAARRLKEVKQEAAAAGENRYLTSILPIWNSWFVSDSISSDGLFSGDVPAKLLPGQIGPEYPANLRKSGVAGSVKVEYVLGRSGVVDIRTVRIVASPHPILSLSVREALLRLRFAAPVVDGQPVRARLTQDFVFSLSP